VINLTFPLNAFKRSVANVFAAPAASSAASAPGPMPAAVPSLWKSMLVVPWGRKLDDAEALNDSAVWHGGADTNDPFPPTWGR
jgi:hypothetical protein